MTAPVTITEETFDPENPLHIMTDQFFRQVLQMYLAASKTTLFREMEPDQKLSAYINGTMTAVMTIMLMSSKSGKAEALVDVVRQAVDVSRANAEMQITRMKLEA